MKIVAKNLLQLCWGAVAFWLFDTLQKVSKQHQTEPCGYAVLFFSACFWIKLSGQALSTGIENNYYMYSTFIIC
jgi:hypothetical protein